MDETIYDLSIPEISQLGLEDFYFFSRIILGYNYMVPHVHMLVCDFLSDENIRKKLIQLPRGFLKTTLSSVAFPIWFATRKFYLEKYDARCLICQNTITNAKKRIAEIRGHYESNALFRACYPETMPDDFRRRWSDESAAIQRHNPGLPEGTFEAAGVGTQVTSRHYDLICEDDTVASKKDDLTAEEIEPNMEDVEKAVGWHKLASSLAILPGKEIRVVIGTRWFQNDMIQYVLEKEPAFRNFVMKAVDAEGIPTYPERYPLDVLEEIKQEQGSYIYATQYLLDPMPSEKMIFKPEWNRYFDPANLPFTSNVIAVDPAISQKKDACDTSIVCCGSDDTRNIYVIDYKSDHYDIGTTLDVIVDMVRQYEPYALVVETIAYQAALAQLLRERLQRDGLYIAVTEEVPGSDDRKDMRIRSMTPYFERGVVYMRKNQTKLVKQLREYNPTAGSKKDILDAMAYAFRHLRVPPVAMPKVTKDPFSWDSVYEELLSRGKSKDIFAKSRSAIGGRNYAY